MITQGGGNNINQCKDKAHLIVKGFIDELRSFGLPKEKSGHKNGGINITLTQTANQDVKVDLNVVISAFQEELSNKQLKEIQAIAENEPDNELKKVKIVEKIKSFGSDVMSNILANILTNPQIFG